MFEELKGISARNVIESEETALEKLISIGREAIKNTQKINYDYYIFFVFYHNFEFRDSFYNEIEEKLDFDYCPEDIVSLMRAESTVLDSEKDKQSFGFYTGALLSLLTDKNRKLGKETVIHIKNIDLDYMLLGVKNADTIIIENCEGNQILTYAGSYEGEIRRIIIQNTEGEFIGSEIGSAKGNVKDIIMDNIKGSNTGVGIAKNGGKVTNIMITNVGGDDTCVSIAEGYGYVNNMIINKIKGHRTAGWIARWGGYVNNMIISNTEGKNIGLWIAVHNGKVNNLIIKHKEGICDYHGNKDICGKIELLLIDKFNDRDILLEYASKEIIRKEETPELYTKRINELGLKEVMELLEEPELDTERLLEALKNA